MKIFAAIRAWWNRPSRKQLIERIWILENDYEYQIHYTAENWRQREHTLQKELEHTRAELSRAREYLRVNHPNSSGQTMGLVHCGDAEVVANMDRMSSIHPGIVDIAYKCPTCGESGTIVKTHVGQDEWRYFDLCCNGCGKKWCEKVLNPDVICNSEGNCQ